MGIKRVLRDRISDGVFGYRKVINSKVLEQKSCRILMYHSVENSNSAEDKMGLAVPPEIFYMHMKYLKKNGFCVIDLLELAAKIADGSPIPAKSTAITFDDGFKGVLTHALPVLEGFNFKATLFVNVYFIQRQLPPGLYWRNWQTLDWGQVRELHEKGMAIGSHGYTHRRLTRVARYELKKEIAQSKELIERNIGDRIRTFSYPNGAFNKEIKNAVKEEGFLCSCSSVEGLNNADSDLFALRRTEVSAYEDTLLKFEKKMLGCTDWLGFVRSYD